MNIGESEIRLFQERKVNQSAIRLKMTNFNNKIKVQTKIVIRN